MKLNDIFSGKFDAAEWEVKSYQLPKFDIQALREKTAKEPTWVHFGGGNIFRAFPAAILNDALNTGKYDRGVIQQPLAARVASEHRHHREEGYRICNRSFKGRSTIH